MSEAIPLSEELRATIGGHEPPVLREVCASSIRLYAQALGYGDPVYYDEAVAIERGHPTLPAPLGFYGVAVYDPRAPRPEPRRPTRPAFTRWLDGGLEVEPLATVYAGDRIESITQLVDVRLREGRLGPMVIRSSETVHTRLSDGVRVGRVVSTVISY